MHLKKVVKIKICSGISKIVPQFEYLFVIQKNVRRFKKRSQVSEKNIQNFETFQEFIKKYSQI